MICVDVAGVGMSQPDKVLFSDVDLSVSVGDRVALVGVNGSGKTTLLRILAGDLEPSSGVVRRGRGARIAYLPQDPQLPSGTVGDVLGDSWEVAAMASRLGVQELVDRSTDTLSGGQAKRVALAVVLAAEQQDRHDMVVLDEPTNHLDLEAIEWLEQRLSAMKSALVLVTHDRHVLDRLTTGVGPGRVVELDGGRAFVHRAAAGTSAYAAYLEGRADRISREEHAESVRKNLARRELAWLRRGAPARSTKPKARLRSANEVVSSGPGAADLRDSELQLGVGTQRLGNQVIELEHVGQAFARHPESGEREATEVAVGGEPRATASPVPETGNAATSSGSAARAASASDEDPAGESHRVFAGIDLVIEPGARLAVVGPNGSGKTTLLDIIAGRAEPTEGVVRRGRTVVVGYADQHSSTLDPEAVVRELVAGPYREPNHEDRALLERFWFDAAAQYARVRMLSGGERRRLQLVMVLAQQPNVLVLDEPTNDLDLDTLRALEAFFDDWPGALVVASHDRAFLDAVADHVLAVEPGGGVGRVPGGVAGWLAERSAGSAASAGAASGVAAGTSPRSGTARVGGAKTAQGDGGSARGGGNRGGGGPGGSGAGGKRGGGDTRRQSSSGPSPSTLGRRLRDTEQAVARAQRRVDTLNERLSGASDHAELAEIGAELATAQAELDDLEATWFEIAEQM